MSTVLDRKTSSFKIKSKVFLVIVISIFSIYLIHLFNLQVVNTLFWVQEATRTSQRRQVIPAPRGEIYDRNHDLPLVLNIDSYVVNINPAEVPLGLFENIIQSISELLDIDAEKLLNQIPLEQRRGYQNLELKNGVPYSTIVKIAERIEEFPGINWNNSDLRLYADSGSMSHILGYVGKISNEEWHVLNNQGYTRDNIIGKRGVEQAFDSLLRGQNGERFRRVDASGRLVSEEGREISPELGNHIVLTIDRHIQDLAEKALGERIGSIVVLRPGTGEVLAMVSYPNFDSNSFLDESRSSYFNTLRMDDRYPFLFRPIQSVYPPASAFKTILTAAILNEPDISPNERVNCTGSLRVGNMTFHCHRASGHGPLDLKGALAESCNVYYYSMGLRLGAERIQKYAQDFGFGQPTLIDIPGETNQSMVPGPTWKKRTFGEDWVGGDTVNMSIGQGYVLVSPLQMANAFAMIVNEGVIYRPHVIKEVHNPNTGEVTQTEPQILHQNDLSPEVYQKLKNYLRGVVTQGTAAPVSLTRSTTVAGKTGTAEVWGEEDSNHSWYAAYAPYDSQDIEEQVVVVAMIEARNTWEWWAPKAADIIFHGIFKNMNYDEVIKDLRPWYVW